MHAFQVNDLIARSAQQDERYQEFLRVPSMSMGLYTLRAETVDDQQPHSEDEVYVVVAGRGQIRVADEDLLVSAGSVVYVPAHMEHRFHTITETLQVLVLFAPAEQHAKSASTG